MHEKFTPGSFRAAHRIKVAFMPLATEEGIAGIIAEETHEAEYRKALETLANYPCNEDGPRAWVLGMMAVAHAALALAGGEQ